MSDKRNNILATLVITAVVIVIFKSLFRFIIPSSYLTLLAIGFLSVVGACQLINYKNLKPHLPFINAISLSALVLLLAYLGVGLIVGNEQTTAKAMGITFLQFSFLPILFFTVNNLGKEQVKSAKNLVAIASLIFVIAGIVELLLPIQWRLSIIEYAEFMINGKHLVPVSYIVRDLGFDFWRLGSLYFEPVTLGLVAVIYLIAQLSTSRKIYDWRIILSVIVCVFSFAKIAWLGLLMIPFYFITKSLNHKVVNAIVVGLSLQMFLVLSPFIQDHFRSMGNHFAGLENGLSAAIVSPLGHGMGTAGYLVFGEFSKTNPGPFVFEEEFSEVRNGNESTVGVLMYQFGFPFTLVYLSLILVGLFISNGLENQQKVFYSALALIGLGAFISESILSVIVGVHLVVYFVYLGTLKNQTSNE